jgi:hypothetical protein
MQQFQQRIPTKASPYGVVHSRRQAKPAFSVTRRGRTGTAMAPEDAQSLIDERTTLQALFVEYMLAVGFPSLLQPNPVTSRAKAVAMIKSWDIIHPEQKISTIAMKWYNELTLGEFNAGVTELANPAITKKDTVREKFIRMATEIDTPAKFAVVKANHKGLFKPREMTALPTDPVQLAAHKKAQAEKSKKNADDRKQAEFTKITDGGTTLKTIPEVTYAFNNILESMVISAFRSDIKGSALAAVFARENEARRPGPVGKIGILYYTEAKKRMLVELSKLPVVAVGVIEGKYSEFENHCGAMFGLMYIRENIHVTAKKFSIPVDILTPGSGFTCGGPCDTKRTHVYKCSKGGVEKRGCWVTNNTHAVSKHGVTSVYDAEATARFARGEPIDQVGGQIGGDPEMNAWREAMADVHKAPM